MADLNDVKLFGRVVKDAELKTSPKGTKYLRFSIATSHDKKVGGKWESSADFFPLTLYGNFAESMQKFLLKGQKVIVDGYLKQDKWEKDGVKKSAISLGVKNLQLIFDSKKTEKTEQENASFVFDDIQEDDEVYIENEEYGAIY